MIINLNTLKKNVCLLRLLLNLVEQNRLKARQTGAGRPNKLDEETMEMVVQTLEMLIYFIKA